MEAEAIIEAKIRTFCKSRYMHNNSKTMVVDRSATMIVNSYSMKYKTLDARFSADVVGDRRGGIKDPVKTVQQQFLWRKVIPMCAG